MILPTRTVKKPWGRVTLPPPFLNPGSEPVGEIWFEPPDELPQLLNVFVGDMSLVGPRPMCPDQRQQYPGTAYFMMRPGITGLWQVSERNACSFAERAIYDGRYAGAMSFRTDLWILALTPLVVLRGTGV